MNEIRNAAFPDTAIEICWLRTRPGGRKLKHQSALGETSSRPTAAKVQE